MIQQQNINIKQQLKHPVGKAHYVGTSVVITLHPSHVKRLDIDDFTFFIQKPVENGILLQMRKLDINSVDDQERGKNGI